ncbi:polyribonucleotide nucleotidyltransferase [endosymbiont GvMRE of Glomus versiforme]|uniref:polyribonucleotide nucleotidyltransferase n=1 Tax=endosymbiont GvMRE of Glomus versiforme TaxID=2039283 RepID=UPI000EBEBAE0|nr:polyribonucleotide nucleotidyltransferase [endosymbiont GvMRE of Glomus versiforme]RHZ37514.1 Polyribonucleotide nucleotidyltransferase [endosymbiont GvMRE of Glomus versiforme]
MNNSTQKKFEFTFQGKKIIFEIDQLATKSEKSVLCRYGNTVVLTVLCLKQSAESSKLNFVPLTVFFEEKFYSVGKIPAVFNKREGKPDYNSVTIARLIDRSIRSFFPLGGQYEIQITNSVLAFDSAADPRLVACWNSILVCYLSPLLSSFNQPLATVVISKNQEEFICNPSIIQLDESPFELIITATKENIVMLELGAEEIAEKELEKAVIFAQKQIQQLLQFFQQIANSLNISKNSFLTPEKSIDKNWQEKIKEKLEKILTAKDNWLNKEKKLQETLQELKKNPEQDTNAWEEEIEQIWDLTLQNWMQTNFRRTQQRIDGRKKEEIRPLNMKINYLPNVHSSALFQRGETQVLSVVTLGKTSDRQLIDNIFVHTHKHFIHHYNFPAFAVNEIEKFKSTSRREIGHGQLVEKTFPPLLPSVDTFPYTIRVVSEVLGSDGSSSQASICATSLALMTAGVPMKRPVAGIALGLLEGEILVDINGLEDKFGEMDYKIAGTEKGVCSLQLDVKNQGISFLIFQKSLQEGKKARIYLLREMSNFLPKTRPQLPTQAIKFKKIFVGAERFGLIIGSQGKTINRLIQETGVEIDLQQPSGFVLLYHHDEQQLIKAVRFIESQIKKK